MTELVLRSVDGAVTRLTLNHLASRNSLSLEMIGALHKEINAIATPVAVIAANGPVFCAGHNLKEITTHRRDNDNGAAFFAELFNACGELMMAIAKSNCAVIAEVDGLASAAGCQLVASCDLAVASRHARFCTPGVNIGLFCSTPMVALSRAVSRKHAMEMLLTGEVISADDAFRMGLVNRVVEQSELRSAIDELAHHIAGRSTEAVQIGKQAFLQQEALPVADAYAEMALVMANNLQCEDAKEGIGAFLEKREPTWNKT